MSSSDISEVFQSVWQSAQKQAEHPIADDVLPIDFVPDALAALGLNAEDEMVLGIFADCAQPMSNISSRVSGGNTLGVPLHQFLEVCQVLVAEQARSEAKQATQGRRNSDRTESAGDESASATSSDEGSSAEIPPSSDDEDSDDDGDNEYMSQQRTRKPTRREKAPNRSASRKNLEDASHVLQRLLAAAHPNKAERGGVLTASDLIAASRQVGESLSEADVSSRPATNRRRLDLCPAADRPYARPGK